jgi:FdhD protein
MRPLRTPKDSTTGTRLWRFQAGAAEEGADRLATEEPLEIRLIQGDRRRTVAVTMRTPGNDAELAVGFLFAEGVIDAPGRVLRVEHCEEVEEIGGACSNIVEVELDPEGPEPDLAPLERHFFTSSACGVCGKAGLEALRVRVSGPLPAGPVISPEILKTLPGRLRESQGLFETTGGLHAAALFDASGNLIALREDVGRHNALDKLIGWAFMENLLPLNDDVVLVSGRSSYEILQKCLVAGVPMVCAVSAPSSLAVELAERYGVTLVGFLRGDRFNVYSGAGRVEGLTSGSGQGARRRGERVVFPTL